MPISRKLKNFTVSELNELSKEYDDHVPSMAVAKSVTARAMQIWIKKHSRKIVTVIYVAKE